jgi:hypothetical protein
LFAAYGIATDESDTTTEESDIVAVNALRDRETRMARGRLLSNPMWRCSGDACASFAAGPGQG